MVLTPVAAGAGGAAVYVQTMVEMLSEHYNMLVVGPRNEGRDVVSQGCAYVGGFPRWASKDRLLIRDVIAYGVQNLSYMYVLWLLVFFRPKTVVVHGSLHNKPDILWRVLNWAKCLRINLVVDVRDALLPVRYKKKLDAYHTVIACSDSVYRHIKAMGVDQNKLRKIPVVQMPVELLPTPATQTKVVTPYILFAGALKESKGADLVLRAFTQTVSARLPNMSLVMAGLNKAKDKSWLSLLKHPKVKYLGPLPHSEVLNLVSRADMVVLPSLSEGMPRICLEGLTLEKKVILPACVPEFVEHCPSFVFDGVNYVELAEQMVSVALAEQVPRYPYERHSHEVVCQLYLDVLG